MLARLNTPIIANSGATLVATACGALGKQIADLAAGGHANALALTLTFAALVIGTALAYLGRPSTLPAPTVKIPEDAPAVPPKTLDKL